MEKKNIWNILTASDEKFTKREILVYGILYPASVVAAIVVASLILK